jgi:ribosome-associated protein
VLCAQIAQEKLAKNILLMNLKKIEYAPTDYFVICTCDSDIQARAIAEAISKQADIFNLEHPRVEGLDFARWVLLDFFDVVVHIMLEETRAFYKIEKLWGDAEFLELQNQGTTKKIKIISFDKIYSSDF